MTDRSINDLCPNLQIIAREVLAQGNALGKRAGWTVGLIVTYRPPSDQDIAHFQGKSNAAAGQSPHNVCDAHGPSSWAFDYGIFESNGKYVENGEDLRYRQIGEIGKSLGLDWGGNWHHPDWDHLQLPGWQAALAKQQSKETV